MNTKTNSDKNTTTKRTRKSSFRIAGTNGSFRGRLAVFAIRFTGSLPLYWVQALGVLFGKLSVALNTREVKIARRNLELCFPDLNPTSRAALLKNSFKHSGMLAAETARVWSSSPDLLNKDIKSIEGFDLLQQAIATNKGLVLIFPHLGNWEMANPYLTKFLDLTAMYSPAQLKEVNELMLKGRERTGLKLAEANPRGILKLISSIKQGGSLVILPDQEPARANGMFAPFFGIEALTMTLISRILSKTGAKPLLIYVKRLGLGEGFSLIVRELPRDIHSDDLLVSLTALNASVEAAVRELPEQYMWGYKRFKRRPEGQPKLY